MASLLAPDEHPSHEAPPSTPQPHDLQNPPPKDSQRSASPSTSMAAADLSSAPQSSSMTPPPSSQVPTMRRAISPRRSTTPDASSLSSPPPTITNGIKKESFSNTALEIPTQEQIESATADELREILRNVLADNARLDVTSREARMSAAHYKLQHNLLTIESEEAVKRLEVEHDMTRREVQALQDQGRPPAGFDYTSKLKSYCELVQKESEITHRRLHNAKKLIRDKENQLADANDEISRLRERIRQNREHINVLRSPGGPLHMGTPKTSPTTPQHYRTTPKHTPSSVRSVRHQPPGSARPFEALLLADAVLSQENINNSAPSTPIVSRRPNPQTPNRHHRSAQSLSSLPNTPGSSRPANSGLLPSAQFSPEAEARVVNTLGWEATNAPRNRRRKSRDSTISAEDADEIAAATGRSFRDESEDIQESQASQSATEMLRLDPRESFEVAASRTATPNPSDKNTNLQQAKIFGSVTKSVAEKRKRAEEEAIERSHKKLRAAAGEAIGLGIGLDAARA